MGKEDSNYAYFHTGGCVSINVGDGDQMVRELEAKKSKIFNDNIKQVSCILAGKKRIFFSRYNLIMHFEAFLWISYAVHVPDHKSV